MKDERNNIDKLFSEGLGDFNPAPPPGMWERIEPIVSVAGKDREAGYMPPRRLLLPLIAAAVLSGIALLWLMRSTEPAHGPASAIGGVNSNIPSSSEQASASPENTEGKLLPAETSHPAHDTESRTESPALDHPKNASSSSIQYNSKTSEFQDERAPDYNSGITAPATAGTSETVEPVALPRTEMERLAFQSEFINLLRAYPTTMAGEGYVKAFSLSLRNNFRPDFKHRGNIPVLAGIYSTWNIISYGNNHHKQSRSAGFSLSTFRGAWLIETGAEISQSDDNGRYMVNYNSWDSLGYYNKVVSFSTDPANPGTVVFQTKVEGVYDSVDHAYETMTKHRYTYLQIPLMAGYQLYANRLFSISLKGGPVFSMMTGSDEPVARFSSSTGSLESIDDLSPARVTTNWQMAVAAGFGVHLSPRLTLLTEPVYKAYLRPVYQNQRTRPQSFGIKAGLLYRF